MRALRVGSGDTLRPDSGRRKAPHRRFAPVRNDNVEGGCDAGLKASLFHEYRRGQECPRHMGHSRHIGRSAD